MIFNITEMTETEFDPLFPLLSNHLNPNASWCFDGARGCLFETYGPEFEFVHCSNPQSVWTLIESDNDTQYPVNGIQFINRIGYLVSAILVPEGLEMQVELASPK
jgi:hypothetical protein